MSLKKISVLAFITAFVSTLVSCIPTDRSLGAAYIPSDQDLTVHMAEMEIPISMMCSDTIQSYSSSSMMVGTLNTPTFGTVKVSSTISICPEVDSLRFTGNPVFKKLFWQADVISTQQFSDDQEALVQNLYIYQLNRKRDTSDVFSTSFSIKDCKPELATHGIPVINDGKLYVEFTEEIGNQLLNASQAALDSSALFLNEVNGFFVTTDDPDPNVYRGRIDQVDIHDSQVYLVYEFTNYQNIRKDTTVIFTFGGQYSVSTYECSSNGREFGSADDGIFVEGLSGVKPVVKATDIRDALDRWADKAGVDLNKVAITRATLELPFEYDGDWEAMEYFPEYIYPCQRVASQGYVFYTPLDEIYDSSVSRGAINRSTFKYEADINLYIQYMIRAKREDLVREDDLWLMPVTTTSDDDDDSSYYNDYYNMYNYYNYYNPYSYYGGYGMGGYGMGGYGMGYGGYGMGYGGYGYGGYGGYYNPYSYYGMYNNSSSSSQVYYVTDYIKYYVGVLNGNNAVRPPKLKIAYSIVL